VVVDNNMQKGDTISEFPLIMVIKGMRQENGETMMPDLP